MLYAQTRRRLHPRVALDSLCTEIESGRTRHSIVTELSPNGLRLARPADAHCGGTLELEYELPGVDEIIEARGVVCFDSIDRRSAGTRLGRGALVRTSGIRIVSMPARCESVVRDFVYQRWLRPERVYLRG